MKTFLKKHYDKIVLHPWLGIVVWVFSFLIISTIADNNYDIFNWAWALIPTAIVAVLKESNDFTHTIPILVTNKAKKAFSLGDLIATVIIPILVTTIINT